jgi:hypothetical protein
MLFSQERHHRHSREGGNPRTLETLMDSRLRGRLGAGAGVRAGIEAPREHDEK